MRYVYGIVGGWSYETDDVHPVVYASQEAAEDAKLILTKENNYLWAHLIEFEVVE